MANTKSPLDFIESGQKARLLPVVSDSKKEERVTSILLSTFMIVPGFAQEVLSEAGVNISKRSKITGLTEVVFKSKNARKPRPDGLIVITAGKKSWTAIIESKVGSAVLREEQIEEYLNLAKEYGVDALITISNQFAIMPTHHPLSISKQKTKTVSLYHFSWLAVLTKAILASKNKSIDDPEQAIILKELVRYLEHSASGVHSAMKMGKGWKDLCADMQQGAVLKKNAECVIDAVASWQQLSKYLLIKLSEAIGKPVSLHLSRNQKSNSEQFIDDLISGVLTNKKLQTTFEIPNAASNMSVCADLLRRTFSISMRLDAPTDRARATAVINWFTRQLKDSHELNPTIRVHWPRRTPMTSANLEQAIEDPSVLLHGNSKALPSSLEVVYITDLAGRFKGANTFVEDALDATKTFYSAIGQCLNKWVPKPPKIKKRAEETTEGADIKDTTQETSLVVFSNVEKWNESM